ncbi:MAG: glycerol-3-phosphate acyltransferase [Planctomycetota bacterium]|jgi:glycerol-3-phosphate acyltransferase PlsY
MTPFILLIGFAYLLGAVPFGFLIAKAHGKDLRTIGSGNIGATNTVRALGKKWGIFCFVLDVLKGLIPMLLVPMLGAVGAKTAGPGELTLWLTVGCTAVLVLGLFPFYTLCGVGAFAIWLITLLIWRYVSLSSILAAIFFPVLLSIFILLIDSWKLSQLWPLVLAAVLMALLIVVRHRTNIRRLLDGSETKIGQKD